MQNGIKGRLVDYPEVSFIDDLTFSQLENQMIADYQKKYRERTGQEVTLGQADQARLILDACATYLYQGFQWIDRAGKMGLLKYSTGDYLKNLGAQKKVIANEAKSATTVLKFTLSAVMQFNIKIQKGVRVKAGNLYFETMEDAWINTGQTEVVVGARCQTSGFIGNNFLPGELRTIVDPLEYNLSVANTEKTSGGSDAEDDESLAERIYLAPSGYSTAGAEDAYEYWIKSYSQSIKGCKIFTSKPGYVDVYVILENGELPDQTFLDGLAEYLSGETIRPLNDRVVVHAPERVEYDIDVTYYIDKSQKDMEDTIIKAAERGCQNFVEWQKDKIGRDVNPAKLIFYLMQAGIKWPDVKLPVNTVISNQAIAVPGNIKLEYGGIRDD